jgi:hypothetical protein
MARIRSSKLFNDERSDGSMPSEYSGLTCSMADTGMLEAVPRQGSVEMNSAKLTESGFRAKLPVVSALGEFTLMLKH